MQTSKKFRIDVHLPLTTFQKNHHEFAIPDILCSILKNKTGILNMQDYQQIITLRGICCTKISNLLYFTSVSPHTEHITNDDNPGTAFQREIFKPLSVSSAQSIDCYVETMCDIEQLTAFLNLYSRMRNKMKKITNCELPITTEL